MDRLEIEKAENGFQIKVWKEDEEKDSAAEVMYSEPKRYVAANKEEVITLVKEHLND